MKLAGCKSTLNPTVVYSIDCSKAVVVGSKVLVLLFVALWFILWGNLFCLALCYFVLAFFSPFSIVITSLGKELIFVLFVRIFDLCLFGFVLFLPLVVWEGLQLVTVTLPGLFSYLFWSVDLCSPRLGTQPTTLSSSLCLKPCHRSSGLRSPGRTSMPMTWSSLNFSRNVSGGSWLRKK